MVGRQCKLMLLFFIGVLFNFEVAICFGQNDTTNRPTVGLVLSGGGAKGLAHIGVLKVLEEVGIPVDYVGGTSMGSIVAGLYSIGYTAKEIEQIVVEQDWFHLLTDQFQRTSLSVQEKEDYDKYLISFPFQNLQFRLPSGLGAGQNISMLLSDLLLPVADINDFNKFQRPFLCVATDIVTGEEIVLNSGYLPDAIRASMAIPTVFTPVEIDNRLLVDGGLVNNFPVDRIKELNPDIIIGVNLGLKQYTKKDIQNLAAVLEQSIFFQAKEHNLENQKLCDVLISPDIYSNNAASFSNAEELIRIGEDAANKIKHRLLAMADSLGFVHEVCQKVQVVDSLDVATFSINGLERVTSRFLIGKLRLRMPGKIAVDDLVEGIERAYGTQFFEKLTYKIETLENGKVHLILRVKERSSDLIRVGARYDSYFRNQFLLNVTLRNKLIKGSKLSLDLFLGLDPRFIAEYRINTGWKPRKNILFKKNTLGILPDFGLRMDARNQEVNYYENGDLLSNYYYQYIVLQAFGSSLISNSFYLEGGISYEFSGLEKIIQSYEQPIDNNAYLIYGVFKVDSYNKRAFPTKGGFLIGSVQMGKDINTGSSQILPLTKIAVKSEKVFAIKNTITILPRIEAGASIGDTVSPLHRVFLGGNIYNSSSPVGTFKFVGFRYMEKMDKSLLTAGLKIRFNFLQSHFVSFDNNIGKTAPEIQEIFQAPYSYHYGYGFEYGYNSIIGPIELGFYNSNFNKVGWQFYINIGLHF